MLAESSGRTCRHARSIAHEGRRSDRSPHLLKAGPNTRRASASKWAPTNHRSNSMDAVWPRCSWRQDSRWTPDSMRLADHSRKHVTLWRNGSPNRSLKLTRKRCAIRPVSRPSRSATGLAMNIFKRLVARPNRRFKKRSTSNRFMVEYLRREPPHYRCLKPR